MTLRSRVRRLPWSIAAALLAVLTLAAPALAADGDTAPAVQAPPAAAPSGQQPATDQPADRTFTLSAAPAASAGTVAPAATLTCTFTVGYPRHVGRTATVAVTVTCTAPVRQINIRAGLYKNNRLVKDSGQKSFYNTRSARADAAVTCSSGVYQGYGATAILYPAGYQPPTRSGSGFGQAVRIAC